MKKIYIVILSLTLFTATAQQDTQFSHYYFNQLFINPATAGSENVTRFQAIYRTQYAGYQSTFDDGGAPVSQIISANMPLKMIRSGVGLTFVNDKIGASIQRDLKLSYAYQIPVGGSQLALGVNGGLFTRGIDYGRLRPRDDNDPLLGTGVVSQSSLDLGAGAYFFNPTYSIGLSVNHLNEPKFGLSSNGATNVLQRSAYLSGSMLFGVSYMIDVSPMFLLNANLSNMSISTFSAGAIATYDNTYYLGASYRVGDAVTALLGANILNGNLRIGYAIDVIVGGVQAKSATTHEVMLSYALSPPRAGKKSIIRTPRYRY
ncbi:type IX secretion system membrane protein PorP/SprF [Emticicia sp. BO119]|uniref:PorP/SprF family type IX secretion system membrane protein n=1 Tax=Emticicia sp. BO119 TaxID=2757768 RepID=UPI0015F07FDC|nr:type IX secretion system membrane protein PorP/SprF [Emticicia sp. BO119]MBA4850337.1 type IX secretion system membrane protein PorP/SprF [Emticicia sp. BO119]